MDHCYRYLKYVEIQKDFRGGSRTAAKSKMELFVIIVNDGKLLTIITKCFILNVAAVLDPLLDLKCYLESYENFRLEDLQDNIQDSFPKDFDFTQKLQ